MSTINRLSVNLNVMFQGTVEESDCEPSTIISSIARENLGPQSSTAHSFQSIANRNSMFGSLTVDLPPASEKRRKESQVTIVDYPHSQLQQLQTLQQVQALLKNYQAYLDMFNKASATERRFRCAVSTRSVGCRGINGSYFLGEVAVIKPRIEERGTPLVPLGPTGERGRSKFGIDPGESAMMECTAYIIGYQLGVLPITLVNVPEECFPFRLPTVEASPTETPCISMCASDDPSTPVCDITSSFRQASIQQRIPNIGTLFSLPSDQRTKVILSNSEANVRRIALIDLLCHNTDRGQGNILVNASGALIPIDHGLIAPRDFMDPARFEWLSWPAADTPFSESEKKFISCLQWPVIKRMILNLFPQFPTGSLRTLQMSLYTLQAGAKDDRTPAEIGCLYVGIEPVLRLYFNRAKHVLEERHLLENDSALEKELMSAANSCFNDYAGIEHLVEEQSNHLTDQQMDKLHAQIPFLMRVTITQIPAASTPASRVEFVRHNIQDLVGKMAKETSSFA